jgi:hypothetical protein
MAARFFLGLWQMTERTSPARRIVPPAMIPPAPPPPSSTVTAPTFAPKRNRRHLRSTLLIALGVLALAGAIAGGAYAYVASTRASAIKTLRDQTALAQQDSWDADIWLGTAKAGDVQYIGMSFDAGNTFINDLMKTSGTKATPLALMINNKAGTHMIDTTAATLAFADGTTREALATAQVLQSAPDRRAMLAAFPQSFTVSETGQLWGRLVFVPTDIDIKRLSSITIKVDGAPITVVGEYMSGAERKKRRIDYYVEQEKQKGQQH